MLLAKVWVRYSNQDVICRFDLEYFEKVLCLNAVHKKLRLAKIFFLLFLYKVEQCCMQLFECEDISGDPPEPRPVWRNDCSHGLCKEVMFQLFDAV